MYVGHSAYVGHSVQVIGACHLPLRQLQVEESVA